MTKSLWQQRSCRSLNVLMHGKAVPSVMLEFRQAAPGFLTFGPAESLSSGTDASKRRVLSAASIISIFGFARVLLAEIFRPAHMLNTCSLAASAFFWLPTLVSKAKRPTKLLHGPTLFCFLSIQAGIPRVVCHSVLVPSHCVTSCMLCSAVIVRETETESERGTVFGGRA